MPEELKKDASVGNTEDLACAGTCLGITEHVVLASMDTEGQEDYLDWWSRYQVIQCRGCKTLSFRHATGTSDDYIQVNENEWIDNQSVQLYPPRNTASRGIGDDIAMLPRTTARLYRETRTSLLNASPVLTGIGLRALVETVCKEKKATGDNLQKKIDNLVELGILTKTDSDVLHEIRSMGNESAHESKPHPEEQLLLAMEVVEHLLKSVYIIPFKLDKFAKNKP